MCELFILLYSFICTHFCRLVLFNEEKKDNSDMVSVISNRAFPPVILKHIQKQITGTIKEESQTIFINNIHEYLANDEYFLHSFTLIILYDLLNVRLESYFMSIVNHSQGDGLE